MRVSLPRRLLIIPALAVPLAFAAGCRSQAVRPLHPTALLLQRTILLPHVRGRIDHLAIGPRARRLYVAEFDNNAVDIVSLRTGRVVHRIAGLPHPQNTLVAGHKLLVSTEGDGAVRFYSLRHFRLLHTLRLGSDADNMRYQKSTGLALVAHGDSAGAIAAVNPRTFHTVWNIPVNVHPEAYSLGARGKHIFVNAQEASEVEKLSIRRRKAVAKWTLPDGIGGNFALAYDPATQRLFIGCRSPDRMVVLNAKTGHAIKILPLAGVVDDMVFDKQSGCVIAACGHGAVEIFRENKNDGATPVARVPTAPGARTCLFRPRKGLLYLAEPKRGQRAARIVAYKVQIPNAWRRNNTTK